MCYGCLAAPTERHFAALFNCDKVEMATLQQPSKIRMYSYVLCGVICMHR